MRCGKASCLQSNTKLCDPLVVQVQRLSNKGIHRLSNSFRGNKIHLLIGWDDLSIPKRE